MDIYFEKEIVDIKKIENTKKYWLVRTYGGNAYGNYLEENYIGLGLNNVPYEYIKKSLSDDEEAINQLISFIEKNTSYSGGEATKWARQLVSFERDVKVGDTVVVPSKNSASLSIGTVISDTYLVKETRTFTTKKGVEQFPEKRKKIEWEKTIDKDEFQGDLRNLISSQKGLTNADRFFETIEGVLSNLYIKEERIYLVIQINQDEDINAFVLNRFLNCLTYFYNEFCEENGIEKNEDLAIKIKLQSKGKMALSAFALAGVVGISSLLLLSNNTEVKADLKEMKVEGKSDGLLQSISDFLDRKQQRKIEYEIFKDSIQKLKVSHQIDSVKLNDEITDAP